MGYDNIYVHQYSKKLKRACSIGSAIFFFNRKRRAATICLLTKTISYGLIIKFTKFQATINTVIICYFRISTLKVSNIIIINTKQYVFQLFLFFHKKNLDSLCSILSQPGLSA